MISVILLINLSFFNVIFLTFLYHDLKFRKIPNYYFKISAFFSFFLNVAEFFFFFNNIFIFLTLNFFFFFLFFLILFFFFFLK